MGARVDIPLCLLNLFQPRGTERFNSHPAVFEIPMVWLRNGKRYLKTRGDDDDGCGEGGDAE